MRQRTTGLLAVLLILYGSCRGTLDGGSNYIPYRGHNIKLTKVYPDYETYKDDPDNIDPGEIDKVEKLMLEAKIETHLPDRLAVSKAVFDLKFPGYGISGFGETPQKDGSKIVAHSIEIPRKDKDRCFVFRTTGGVYELVDDFVLDSSAGEIADVRYDQGDITYFDRNGVVVHETHRPR
ncbi:MAG TPA: hypothetical protein VEZ90_09070 [Blastocatellia bacterium]|nr:hypothetical protein [Blastocatellia bacterium]